MPGLGRGGLWRVVEAAADAGEAASTMGVLVDVAVRPDWPGGSDFRWSAGLFTGVFLLCFSAQREADQTAWRVRRGAQEVGSVGLDRSVP
jgi:hypothetical protein